MFIVVALVMSVILYVTGVLSGLYANRILEQQTTDKLSSIRDETQREVTGLREYADFLDSMVQEVQLEQAFVELLDSSQVCEYMPLAMEQLLGQLQRYRDVLPFRLEEYERNAELTDEYILLKEQYNKQSLQTWMLAKNVYDTCDVDFSHALYFYSRECDTCIEQGEELDGFNQLLAERGEDLLLFAIDYEADDLIIRFLKTYYNLTETPAVVLNDQVFQGRVFEAEELAEAVA